MVEPIETPFRASTNAWAKKNYVLDGGTYGRHMVNTIE